MITKLLRWELIGLVYLFLCFGFVPVADAVGFSEDSRGTKTNLNPSIGNDLYVLSQDASDASDATITLELVAESSSAPSAQSNFDWRDLDWKDPFVRNGEGKARASSRVPTDSNVSASDSAMPKSLMATELADHSSKKLELKMPSSTSVQVAEAPSTPSAQSNFDWRDLDWKDPFSRHGQVVRASPRAPANSDVSAVIGQVAQSDSKMKLELKMPSSTSIIPSDSFGDLQDPFASPSDAPEMSDPFEDYNRFMFDFNEGFYDNFMEPIVREYRDSVNENIRVGISNIFDNAMAPLKLVSSFLQGDLDKTGRVIGRTIINTTLGLGGMFDVADRAFDIKDVNEDLDQVLGSYGVPTGPYVVLPLFGPSSVRNVFGRAGGMFLSPTYHFAPGVEVGGGLTLTDQINDTSFIVDDIEQLEVSTVDKYESVRDFYGQYRDGLVKE